ncbi:hypothetical protein J3R30DRAFT_3540151 [Lentinula aciculospora]|uniref:F-box domain-containing protein n=1 Tax=Lentinula aciculospora TaxID=153920 RepID=A0A9W8ZZM1_9AGAR|nr:hypothetical protein J3R30DRAFT_3540151 [Lentinula aciculospora]
MAILPQELVDYTLDFLHTSVPSLSSSSLVSRSWLPATRYHLFRIPVLYQVSFERGPKNNINSFIELLKSPLCTFRHTIQGCVLNIEFKEQLRKCVDTLATHTTITGPLLITQSCGTSCRHDLGIPQKFPLMRSFVFSYRSDEWMSDFRHLVISLAHIENLAVFTNIGVGVRWPLPDSSTLSSVLPFTPSSVLPNLRTLRLRMFNPSEFLQWMLNLGGYTPHIETLDIVICHDYRTGWGLIDSLKPFLVANRYSLKHLSLGMEYGYNIHHNSHGQFPQRLHIGSLPNLRSLSLQTHDVVALCKTTTSFLRKHPFTLEVLTLNIAPFIFLDESYDEAHFRSTIRETLDPEIFARKVIRFDLNIMCLIFPCEDDLDKAETLSRDLLPGWEGLGKLTVKVVQGRKSQVDSLERINGTIWGTRIVPFKELRRVGTL